MTDHGYAAYSRRNGCRCDVCREAKRVYVAQRRADGAEPTRTGVSARPDWNDRSRKNRVGLRRFRVKEAAHGTTTGYRVGCRCWPCTDAECTRQRNRRTA